MITFALAILLAGAALCFGLSRLLPTRPLGAGAGLLCLVGAVLALAGEPAEPPVADLITLGGAVFSVTPWLAPGERGVAAALLIGSAAALLALAGAIAGAVRGFGALFGWSLLCVAAALLSQAAPPFSLIQPLAWAVLALAGYGALRASGAASSAERPPLGLTLGLVASALLMVALLGGGAAVAEGTAPSALTAAAGFAAVLALVGGPPLLLAREEAVDSPAPLGALIFGLCAPAAGLGWLLRASAALPVLPAGWTLALALIGGLGALACGAGALGEQRLRPILAWAGGAQAALVVAAVGLAGPLAALAGPSLLTALMLSAALGAAAAVSFERVAGTDDYTTGAGAPRPAAAFWAVGAVASLGLPPLWGFWGRLWLLEAALEQQPWLVPALLAGTILLALALLAPLGGLTAPARAQASWADWAPATLALLPLLAFGAAPGRAWELWLQAVTFAPPAPPIDPVGRSVGLAASLALAAAAALIVRGTPVRNLQRDPDEDAVRLAPEALGDTLQPLAWLAGPRPLLRGAWELLARSSEALRLAMGLFEQRYYLLGVLGALVTIMLLMAQ